MHGDIARSAAMGEYYRDLSLNYTQYQETNTWPSPPFAPSVHLTIDYLPED